MPQCDEPRRGKRREGRVQVCFPPLHAGAADGERQLADEGYRVRASVGVSACERRAGEGGQRVRLRERAVLPDDDDDDRPAACGRGAEGARGLRDAAGGGGEVRGGPGGREGRHGGGQGRAGVRRDGREGAQEDGERDKWSISEGGGEGEVGTEFEGE